MADPQKRAAVAVIMRAPLINDKDEVWGREKLTQIYAWAQSTQTAANFLFTLPGLCLRHRRIPFSWYITRQ